VSSYSRFSFSSQTNVDSGSDEDVHTMENPGGGSSKFCQGVLDFWGKSQGGVQHLTKPFFWKFAWGVPNETPLPLSPRFPVCIFAHVGSFDSLIGTQGNLFTPQPAELVERLGKRGSFDLDFFKCTIPSNYDTLFIAHLSIFRLLKWFICYVSKTLFELFKENLKFI
jgi:hypothetical protein